MIQTQSLPLIAGGNGIHHLEDPAGHLHTAHRINIVSGDLLPPLCVGDQLIELIFHIGHGIFHLLQKIGGGAF